MVWAYAKKALLLKLNLLNTPKREFLEIFMNLKGSPHPTFSFMLRIALTILLQHKFIF